MDFFERQSRARRRTKWLVVLFCAAIVGIVGALYGLVVAVGGPPYWQPELLAAVAVMVLLVVGGGSLFKIYQLAQGGATVASLLGGVPVHPQTRDPQLRQLLNVVEEMALASGTPVPGLYLLPEDDSINAFAAGHSLSDAVIGVTQGTLNHLTRDELQGVIAHEFSHILNGDMRLNIRLMGLLFGILCLALLGQLLLRVAWLYRPRNNERNSGGVIFLAGMAGLVLMVVGYVGVFFARLIQSAVSRQREFLADAAAVQFTRNPEGIAGALYKIGQFSSRLRSAHAVEACHMFFGNGLREVWLGLFATHPPLKERIEAIAPGFRPGASPARRPVTPPPLPREKPSPPTAARAGQAPEGLLPPNWFGRVGAPEAAQLVQAGVLLASLPEATMASLRELHGATALVYALLLDPSPSIREKQLAALAADALTLAEVQAHWARREQLSSAQEIALIDLAIATLRQLSPEQYRVFRQNVEALIAADGQMALFEFLLEKILVRHLDRSFGSGQAVGVRYHSLVPLLPDVATLFGALAHLGQDGSAAGKTAEAIAQSFQAGVRALGRPAHEPALTLPPKVDLAQVSVALEHVSEAAPEIKRQILAACGEVVRADGLVAAREGQLLRAMADALDCPVPLLAN